MTFVKAVCPTVHLLSMAGIAHMRALFPEWKTFGLLAVASFLLAACGEGADPHGHGHDDHAHGAEEEDYARGPNGGRLLEADGFAVEITIFEEGRTPQFRVFPYSKGDAVDPQKVDLSITLGRLGGKVDRFKFGPEGRYLAGDGIVTEPHSFDVAVEATYDGTSYDWQYASYEGRTIIPQTAAREAGVVTEAVGKAEIVETIDVLGRVKFAPGAQATLRARFAGEVTDVFKTVGDLVDAGEKLARVQSNASQRAYDVLSPITGIVIERQANRGDVADQAPLFVVGDLKKLNVDFHIFAGDLPQIRPGQSVKVSSVHGDATVETQIETLLPTKETATQTIIGRAPLLNEQGLWIPGMTVSGIITVRRENVPLAVRSEALQRFRDFTVVYAQVGDTYEVRMLNLGRQTPDWVEVLGGIEAGDRYVTQNSYLIKADIEKSGASHDH